MHNPFPTSILISNKPPTCSVVENGRQRIWTGENTTSCENEKLHENCFEHMANLVFYGMSGTMFMRAVCLPFPPYDIQCGIKIRSHLNASDELFVMKVSSQDNKTVLSSISFNAKELNMLPAMLSSIARVIVVPVDLMQIELPNEILNDIIKNKKRKISDIEQNINLHQLYIKDKNKDIDKDTSLILTQASKPFSKYAFQREFPSFTNMCGYMLLQYRPNAVYTESSFMVLHSNDQRLGRGDMVSQICIVQIVPDM